ncbi:ABC transporter permease [Rugamonas aquatica]|uniref:ABC transporter permease subunit n=1 Tax=Rugamonas aquatica TaxID=2743357 RepID=A0A6A7N4I6_9BURK|nr:ABC transporter permease subunit [Rugamonas aquatica]MQA39791.1 ABC transporter permease subunit [Rugamonas aquatica]
MMPLWLVVMKKELSEALRDKRTLSMLLMLTLVYPALVGFLLHTMIERGTRTEKAGIDLVVVGGAQAPNLLAQLRQKNVNVSESAAMSDADIGALLRKKKVVGVLRLAPEFGEYYAELRPAPLELWFDSSAEKRDQRLEVETILREYSNSVASARLQAHGVSAVILSPLRLQRYDSVSSATGGNARISAMLGMFFIPVLLFGLSSAIDSTAGERERRSLEVLMAQPIPVRELVAGKWLAASALAAIGLTVELLVAHGVLSKLPLEEIGMSWRLSLPMLAMVIGSTLPLCLFVGAVQVAMAMNSKTFKEAQASASIVAMLPILPLVIIPMMDLSTQNWMYAVPVLSNQTMFQALATGQALGWVPYALTCVLPLLLAGVAIAFASFRMKSERYVLAV